MRSSLRARVATASTITLWLRCRHPRRPVLRLAGRPSQRLLFPELLTMLRPNFCSDCGTKIIRLHWHPWTSRRFCASCSQRLKKERLTLPLVAGIALFGIGLAAGRAARSPTPPMIIERSAALPPANGGNEAKVEPATENPGMNVSASPATESQQLRSSETVYICGARTKKGRPCSRRLPEAVRCWQHKGMPSMIPVVPIE